MILLTAFEPFGLKGWATGTNASQVVQSRILGASPGRYGSVVLPLGEACLGRLREALAGQPWTGVLALGESGGITSEHVVLEPFANDIARPAVWKLPVFSGQVASAFATDAKAPKRGGAGSMGAYWCNRVHLEALAWSRGRANAPVAFVHVPAVIGAALPVYGDHVEALYRRYAAEVQAILDQMQARAA